MSGFVRFCYCMAYSYAELSHSLFLYFLVPCVTIYVCYLAHGIQEQRLFEDRVLAVSSFLKKNVPLNTYVYTYFTFFLPVFFFFICFKGSDFTGLTVVGAVFALNIK
jgi:hypothetical protein